MKKISVAGIIALVLFFRSTANAFHPMPIGSDFSFELKAGPGEIDLGDVLFALPQGFSLMKFRSSAGLKDNLTIPAYYGMLTKTSTDNDTPNNKELYYYFSYVQCGYIQDTSLTRQDCRDVLTDTGKVNGGAQIKSEPLVLELTETKGYILSLTNPVTNTVSFLGVFPGRHGVSCLSCTSAVPATIGQNLLNFSSIAQAFSFKIGEQYQDFLEGKDPVFVSTLKNYLWSYLHNAPIQALDVGTETSSFTASKKQDGASEGTKPEKTEKTPPLFAQMPSSAGTENNQQENSTAEKPVSGNGDWIVAIGVCLLMARYGKKVTPHIQELKRNRGKW